MPTHELRIREDRTRTLKVLCIKLINPIDASLPATFEAGKVPLLAPPLPLLFFTISMKHLAIAILNFAGSKMNI